MTVVRSLESQQKDSPAMGDKGVNSRRTSKLLLPSPSKTHFWHYAPFGEGHPSPPLLSPAFPPQGSEQMNLIAQHTPQLVSSWSKLIICFNFCQKEISKKKRAWMEKEKQQRKAREVKLYFDYPMELSWREQRGESLFRGSRTVLKPGSNRPQETSRYPYDPSFQFHCS